jgi:histidine triad (HIT) family protein
MDDCPFCRIVAKNTPARIVYEDDRIMAFEDIRPKAPTHTLVIPKEHFSSLNELPDEKAGLLTDLLLIARKIARDKGIDRSGYRIVLNTAGDSGQEVPHIHFHILGGRRMSWPPG